MTTILPVPATVAHEAGSSDLAAAVLADLERAWNEADGPAFGRPFADDCDFVDVRGDHHVGRAAVAAGHQGIFESIYAGSTVHYHLESAREVRPGCIVAVAAAELVVPTGPMAGTNRSRLTIVLVA